MAELVFVEWQEQSSGHLPRNGIAGSCDRFTFSILSILQTDFQSACISLCSHQQLMKAPPSLSFIFVSICCHFFLPFSFLTGVR